MSDLTDAWRIEVTEYHGGFRAEVFQPRRTTFRKRLVYQTPFYWVTAKGGSNPRARAVGDALSVIPKSVKYEVVTADDE